MQTAFNLNMLALVDGQPQTLPLKSVLSHYVAHRREIVRRRTEFDLEKARARAHILEGLKIALDNLDAVIKTIRESADVERPRTNLMTGFGLSEPQAQAILDMRLARLAALERQKIEDEYLAVIQLIAELEDILANPSRVLSIIKDELDRAEAQVRRRAPHEGRRRLEPRDDRRGPDRRRGRRRSRSAGRGYIKRQPVATYRRQHRGGKGIIGHVTREEDAVEHLLVANTHDWALFFTNRGRVFSAKVHLIPDASRQAKGMAIINLPGVQVESGEVPVATIVPPELRARALPGAWRPATGSSRRRRSSSSSACARPGSGRSRSTTTTSWPGSSVSSGEDDVIIATSQGMLARFSEDEVRPMGRDAAGVIGIRLLKRENDSVVSMSVVEPEADLLVLTETGYGKRVGLTEFRQQAPRRPGRPAHRARGPQDRPRRGGPAGHAEDEELLLISRRGQVIRTETNTINRYSPSARGVIVMRLAEGDQVVAIAAFRRRAGGARCHGRQ